MAQQIRDIRGPNPTPVPLLVAAHCSTIRRKAKRFDIKELTSIFDDLLRELNTTTSASPKAYLNPLNEIVSVLNSSLPPALLGISSHYFFVFVRNTVRDLLQQLYTEKQLNDQEIYILRNCILLFHHIAEKINDVLTILHWITEATFLDALANCLNDINKISKRDPSQRTVKQIARLLDMFCIVQERLALDFHQTFFVRLLQPTIDCLLSSNYVKLFQSFKPYATTFTEKQKLFLLKCPYFLTTYNGPHIEKAIEQVLEIMLPRYVTILDQHMKTIKEWRRPIMRAVHNLIITIVYAEGYFASYTKSESFRALINHLLNILSEPTLINRIHSSSNNIETLLVDATLVVFSVLVYESDALDYIKQRKPTAIFRQLTKTPYETIVLNAYMMLAYTMDDNDMKTSQADLTQLLSTTFTLLRKTIENRVQMSTDQNFDRENIDRNIFQLLETLKGLSQYEQIRIEILNQGILTFLIDSYKKLHGLSRQILLECLWKLSFNDRIVQQFRAHPQFIQTLESIPKPDGGNIPHNILRRSNSYIAGRTTMSTALNDAANYGIQKVADGLLWKIVKESQFREEILAKMQTNVASDQKYKYNIMLSYSYADKDIVDKIHQLLANEGYKIWFDRDHNNGLAMEMIAEATENSELVIICMSDSYKRDNHCQAQAEYALLSRRLILPLVVHSNYKPDGWLTSIMHNNIYIDFGRHDFRVASEFLLREIQQRQRRKEISGVRSITSTPSGLARNLSNGSMSSFDTPYIPIESSALNGTNSSSMSSFPSVIINRQQQGSLNATSQSSTPGVTFTVSPIIIDKQQQAPVQSTSTSSVPNSFHSGAPMIVNRQQQPTPSMYPLPKLSTAAGSSFNTSNTATHQREVLVYSGSRSSTPSTASSNPTVITVKQQQQTLVQPVSGSLIPATSAPTNRTVTEKQQQQQPSITPASRSGTPASSTPAVPIMMDKELPQGSLPSVLKSSIPITIPSDAAINIENRQQQQQPINSVTRTPSTGNVSSGTVAQQQRAPSRPNSRATTPAALPVASQTNSRDQGRLPEQYTDRKTRNSIYRTISINAWRNNDVLDYLFDSHLYPMMPLCESMSGKALLRLFRMCQRKPSRVYDQLNEELRLRFNGLNLSMGVYTQFLIEMDSLVGPSLDSFPPIAPPTPKIMERVIIVPSAVQKSSAIQPSPGPSIHSSIASRQSKNITPVQTLSGSTTPRNARIIERAIYRPASNVGRPYNFIVESVEEATALHDQVQRYGNQLLLLDETARHHREKNNHR